MNSSPLCSRRKQRIELGEDYGDITADCVSALLLWVYPSIHWTTRLPKWGWLQTTGTGHWESAVVLLLPCELITPRGGDIWLAESYSILWNSLPEAGFFKQARESPFQLALSAWCFLGYLTGSFWWPQKENKRSDWQKKRNSVIQIMNVYRVVWMGPWKILLIPVEVLIFLMACYYRSSTKWKWKKYEWVGVMGVITCARNFPQMSCMSLLQSNVFCYL